MRKLKLTKLIGLSEKDLSEIMGSSLMNYRYARLIPLLKTGDEMALTSILLSAFKLVKEFRQLIFKEIGLPKIGTFHFLTEVSFPEISKERLDGLIIVVKSGKVVDAIILEMKKGSEELKDEQMEQYQSIARQLKIPKMVTVSNQFVSDSTQLPYKIKKYKAVEVSHFSWTYLLTIGRILLYKNNLNIEDRDQVEIMKEVLYYFEGDKSGVQSLMRMPSEWKSLTDDIRAHKTVSVKGDIEYKAVEAWFQLEKHIALKLSQKLGVLVKTKARNKESIKPEISFIEKHKSIKTKFMVKNAVSDIVVEADFEKRNIKQTITLSIPDSGTNVSKVNWLIKQLESAKNRKEIEFNKLTDNVFVEAYIKYQRNPQVAKLDNISDLKDIDKKDEIKEFKIYSVQDIGTKFTSQSGFLKCTEEFIITFYAGYIQHLKNWTKPAPRIDSKKQNISENNSEFSGTTLD